MMVVLDKDNNITTCARMFTSVVFFYLISDSHRLFENKTGLRVLNFGWPLNRAMDNRKPAQGRLKAGATAE